MVRCSPARVAYLVPGGGSAGTKGQYRNTARTITAAVATDAAVTHQCRELRSGASCNACRAALLSAMLLRMTAWLSCHMARSEEHTSELQSLMRNSYAVLCLKK